LLSPPHQSRVPDSWDAVGSLRTGPLDLRSICTDARGVWRRLATRKRVQFRKETGGYTIMIQTAGAARAHFGRYCVRKTPKCGRRKTRFETFPTIHFLVFTWNRCSRPACSRRKTSMRMSSLKHTAVCPFRKLCKTFSMCISAKHRIKMECDCIEL
jgi:hypothetical protein